MELLTIIFLLIIAALGIFLLYKLFRWGLQNKRNRWISLVVLCLVGLSFLINELFFKEMTFVQSRVYPNLYLVKHPIKDRNALNQLIKQKVEVLIDENKLDSNVEYDEYTHKAPYATLAFYTYTKQAKFSLFQDYGTAYFIDHEEDLGGFSVEDLSMYLHEKLATFNLRTYPKDSTQHFGLLEFYEKGYVVRTDTLQNPKN